MLGSLMNWPRWFGRDRIRSSGDYQANCAMPLGKRLGKPVAPQNVAAPVVERMHATPQAIVDEMSAPPEIAAGPGFLHQPSTARRLDCAAIDARGG